MRDMCGGLQNSPRRTKEASRLWLLGRHTKGVTKHRVLIATVGKSLLSGMSSAKVPIIYGMEFKAFAQPWTSATKSL